MAPSFSPPPRENDREICREICRASLSFSLSLSLLFSFVHRALTRLKRNLVNGGGLVKIGLALSDRVDGCQRAAILSAEINAKRGFRGLSSPDIP